MFTAWRLCAAVLVRAVASVTPSGADTIPIDFRKARPVALAAAATPTPPEPESAMGAPQRAATRRSPHFRPRAWLPNQGVSLTGGDGFRAQARQVGGHGQCRCRPDAVAGRRASQQQAQ